MAGEERNVTEEIEGYDQFKAVVDEEFQILGDMLTLRDRLMRLIGEERSPRARNIAITLTQLQLAIGNHHSWVINGGLDATILAATEGNDAAES
jgi:hypothetical protein